LVEVLKVMSVVILITFIIGTVFGLKIGGSSKNNEQQVSDSTFETSEEHDRFFGTSTESEEPKRSDYGYTGQSTTPQRSSSNTGRYAVDEDKPAAEDVARHWARETGQPTSDSDVRLIQAIMKTVDDNK